MIIAGLTVSILMAVVGIVLLIVGKDSVRGDIWIVGSALLAGISVISAI